VRGTSYGFQSPGSHEPCHPPQFYRRHVSFLSRYDGYDATHLAEHWQRLAKLLDGVPTLLIDKKAKILR
jgi:hypothetical protein